jgi:DNA mismatch endonuclease (patch repair protein)
MMAAVHNKDSKAEIAIRTRLFALGLRFRKHYRVATLPRRTIDIAFPGRKIAIFIDGDMWHGNAWRLRGLNSLEELFPTRTEWWVNKIKRNMERDAEINQHLEERGWKVLRFWESRVLTEPDQVVSEIVHVVHEGRGLSKLDQVAKEVGSTSGSDS